MKLSGKFRVGHRMADSTDQSRESEIMWVNRLIHRLEDKFHDMPDVIHYGFVVIEDIVFFEFEVRV